MKPEGKFSDATEARQTYSAHEATRKESKSHPIRPKSSTDAVTVTKGPNFAERPANREYGQYDTGAVSKQGNLKLTDNLRPLTGNMKENDSENKMNFKPYDNVTRPGKARSRDDYIGLPKVEKIDDNTESKNTFVRHDVTKPTKARPRQDVVGLPDGRIEDETETRNTYKGHVLSTKPARQRRKDDNLVPEGEFSDVTEARQTYSAHEAARKESKSHPIRPKSSTDAVTVTKGPNFGERPANHDYGQYDVGTVSKPQNHKLTDNLRPLTGNMKENDSENKMNFKPYDNVTRPGKARSRDDYIGLPKVEKIDDNTESKNTFVRHDVTKPTKARPRQDVVGLPDGRIEDETETKNTYKGHVLSTKPERQRRKDDNLVPIKNAKMIDYTENKKTYLQHPVEKTQRIRHGNNNIALPKGNLESTTEHREIYKSRTGLYNDIERPDMIRRTVDMLPKHDGQFQGDSEFKENYKGHNGLVKPERYKALDHLSSSNGPLDDRTEAKDSFDPKEVQRFERVRGTNGGIGIPEGQFENDTEARNQYLRYSTALTRPSKPERSKNDSCVSVGKEDGSKLEGKSEMQEKFSAKYGRRSDQAKPSENLSIQRSKSMTSLNSITSHDYRGGFDSKRPEKVTVRIYILVGLILLQRFYSLTPPLIFSKLTCRLDAVII